MEICFLNFLSREGWRMEMPVYKDAAVLRNCLHLFGDFRF
jgi:hypothetical protein